MKYLFPSRRVSIVIGKAAKRFPAILEKLLFLVRRSFLAFMAIRSERNLKRPIARVSIRKPSFGRINFPRAWHMARSVVLVLIQIDSNMLLSVAVALQRGGLVV